MEIPDYLKQFSEHLLEYNKKVNLVSRKISPEELCQLLNESLLLDQYIANAFVIDAGSGNGILGIPIAMGNKDRKVTLVEPRQKKFQFLKYVKEELGLPNIDVQGISIEEYLKGLKNVDSSAITLIARGFPQLEVFCRFIKKRLIGEAVIITSENKIKKNEKPLESMAKKIYNVPLRKNLKILKQLGDSKKKGIFQLMFACMRKRI